MSEVPPVVGHEWLLSLAPRGEFADRAEPACPPATIAVATAALGPGPVAWAVRTAREMTGEVLERVPEHGGGTGPFATLRASIESAVLVALRGLLADVPPESGMAAREAMAGGAEFARRGIPLDLVLRGVRVGHARLHQELMAVIETLPEAVRRAESGRVSSLLFAYADAHASWLAEEYLAERARWEAGREPERRRVIEGLLSGREVPAGPASAVLGYELARHHQALIVATSDDQIPATELRRYAEDLCRALGPDGWICLSMVPGQIWAWAGWRAEPSLGQPGPGQPGTGLPRPPVGITVAVGPVAFGSAGMRRSHLGAREASRVAAAAGLGWWCDYPSVRTLCLATADPEQARWYAADVLGPLLADGKRAGDLRNTLRVYLACERSPQAAAQRLHIARNTVTYRVHRAEELLGHPIGDPLELRVALEIARILG